MQRVSVFIDNSNVFKNIYSIKNDTKDFSWVSLYDPLKLGQVLAGSRKLEKVFFYCVPPPSWLLQGNQKDKDRHATAMKYYAAISKLPNVEIKYGYIQGGKNDPHEKNVDTQLSTDMVTEAALNKYDVAILVSNDGDYMSAAENTKKLGKKVELLFFRGYISGALKQVCDVTRRARKSYFQPIVI